MKRGKGHKNLTKGWKKWKEKRQRGKGNGRREAWGGGKLQKLYSRKGRGERNLRGRIRAIERSTESRRTKTKIRREGVPRENPVFRERRKNRWRRRARSFGRVK